MHINAKGLKLVKSFEGCHLKAYLLSGEKYYTIGWGHSFDTNIKASTVWTQAKADAMLKKDLIPFETYVTRYAKKYGFKFNRNQFSALVSYTYNRGCGGLIQLLSNSKTIAQVSTNIVVYWGSATTYKNGLVRRRKAEKVLFDTPVIKKPVAKVTPKSTAAHISWVQTKLGLTVDGVYGAKTIAKVKKYKANHKFTNSDGKVVGLKMIKQLAK